MLCSTIGSLGKDGAVYVHIPYHIFHGLVKINKNSKRET